MADEQQPQATGQTPETPKEQQPPKATPQTDPAAQRQQQQMAGYIANLQQQLADTNRRLDERQMEEMDDEGRANFLLQRERERAANLERQMQDMILQQRRTQDIQALAQTFQSIGVDVSADDLMDSTDVLDAVNRAAAKAKVAIPKKVSEEAARLASEDDNNQPFLGGKSGSSPSADDEIAAAKKSGNPAAVIAAVHRKYANRS